MAKAPKTTTAPTGQIAPFGLRMLPELREKIEAAARESGRSMNAEIVARLESSFAGGTSDVTIHALALKLAQAELNQAVTDVELEAMLVDVNLASMSALNAVKFNEALGYECPLPAEELGEVKDLYENSQALLDSRSHDEFKELLDEMKAANDRAQKLKGQLKRSSHSPKKIQKIKK